MLQHLVTVLTVVLALLLGVNPAVAALTAYSQDFEGLVQADSLALANDGWLVFGNVFDTDGVTYLYGYGAFPAPNTVPPTPAAFCAIVAGEGGPEQGAQQLSVYSDYENADHAAGRFIEANVFQEQTIDSGDGGTWVFTFDAKLGNLAGGSTAAAFIKTLDPANGYALTNFLTVDMTSIPTTWSNYSILITIDAGLAGQLLQFGFLNVATLYEPSGIYYDNVVFGLDPASDASDLAAAGDHSLHPASPNPFRNTAEIQFAIPGPEAVRIELFDVNGRRVASLLDQTMPAGQHRVRWSGLDSAGRSVASGIYFYRMEAEGFSETRKLVKVR